MRLPEHPAGLQFLVRRTERGRYPSGMTRLQGAHSGIRTRESRAPATSRKA